MDRRGFLAGPMALLVAPILVGAQPIKVARVGVVNDFELGPTDLAEELRWGLRDLGWIEGQNLVIVERYAERLEQRREISAEIERLKLDVVVAAPTAAYAASPVGLAPIKTVPIVFSGISDPVGLKMVASLARPGGNMTGLSYQGVELNLKRLQLVKETLPGITRIGVLVPKDHPLRDPAMKEIEAAARSLKIGLHAVEVASTDPANSIDSALDAMARGRAQAVLGLQGPHFNRERKRIADLLLKHRLPGIFQQIGYVEAGCLMAYAASFSDIYRRTTTYVDISKHVGRVNRESMVIGQLAA
jgi:putative ABC transport system substrate-binding protein